MTTRRAKVVFFTTTMMKDRKEFISSLAPPGLEVIREDQSLPDEEKVRVCKDADAIILMAPDISVDLLKKCPNVKLIQTLSSGYDRLDVKRIGEIGIPIANNGGANAIPVAEHTIALMISICRNMMAQWHTSVNQRRWRGTLANLEMVELTNKTVGIVGLGPIGKQVAKRLKGFDTRTIYYDTVEISQEVQRELNAQPLGFEELLGQSDIVTLHVPLNPMTRGMIGERELEMMKPSAYLISTSRGPVIDEKALYQTLKNRRIAGAGLDVLEQEPPAPDNPMLELDNVVITPHMAGFMTQETTLRAAEFAYANIERVLAGKAPESLITPD